MLHYSKRLVPVPPTYERIGAGLGRPFSDLIFAKWGFNNVTGGLSIVLHLYFIKKTKNNQTHKKTKTGHTDRGQAPLSQSRTTHTTPREDTQQSQTESGERNCAPQYKQFRSTPSYMDQYMDLRLHSFRSPQSAAQPGATRPRRRDDSQGLHPHPSTVNAPNPTSHVGLLAVEGLRRSEPG